MPARPSLIRLLASLLCGSMLASCATSSPATPPVPPARIPPPPVQPGLPHLQPMVPILEPLLRRLDELLARPPSSETSSLPKSSPAPAPGLQRQA